MSALRGRNQLRVVLGLLAALEAPVALAQGEADVHLLEGASHFREGRYAKALVEFKVAERLGASAETSWYIAAALVKLERHEEAIEAFAAAERVSPAGRDAVLTYYQALACYGARLFGCADRLLSRVSEDAGPQVRAHAEKIRADIAKLFSASPPVASIDWYHRRAGRAREAGRKALSIAYLEEALALGRKRADGYRVAEAEAAVRVASFPRKEEDSPP